jgi:predicted nucleic acid-binding Zn ribbon protein
MAKYCPWCGTRINEDRATCPKCGKDIISPILYGGRSYQKTNHKKRNIGLKVVLMVVLFIVAIAIAATVYVYIVGMIGGDQTSSPELSCIISDTTGEMIISYAEMNYDWGDIKIKTDNDMVSLNGYPVGTTWTHAFNLNLMGSIDAGDSITIQGSSGRVEITIAYIPTDTIIGTWVKEQGISSEGDVSNAEAISDLIFQKINEERKKHHLTSFVKHENLTKLAYKQSNYMATNDDFFFADEIEDFEVESILDYHISMNYVSQLLAYVPLGYLELNDEARYVMQSDYDTISSYTVELWMDGENQDIILAEDMDGFVLNAGIGVSYHNSDYTQNAYYVCLLSSYE